MRLEVLLLDVEGTTTPISFVKDVLFPYAVNQLHSFLETHATDANVKPLVDDLLKLSSTDAEFNGSFHDESESELARVERFSRWLTEKDRKVTSWKELQGHIWRHGYQSGDLRGALFDDVPEALRRWLNSSASVKRLVCVFSSGSCDAQRQLYAHSQFGNLSTLLSGHFDTNIGVKQKAESYSRIVDCLRLFAAGKHFSAGNTLMINDAVDDRDTNERLVKFDLEKRCEAEQLDVKVLFLTDVLAEANAAREAGLQTFIVSRPGNAPINDFMGHSVITTFDELNTFQF